MDEIFTDGSLAEIQSGSEGEWSYESLKNRINNAKEKAMEVSDVIGLTDKVKEGIVKAKEFADDSGASVAVAGTIGAAKDAI